VVTDHKLDLILQKNKITENINNKKADLEILEKKLTVDQVEKYRKDINILRDKSETLKKQIEKSNETELKNVNDLWVTFTHQRYRNTMLESLQRNSCKRCCLILCCQSYKIRPLYFKGNKWLLTQKSTDEPSNIRWENVPYSACRRRIRTFFAVIIAIIVILASFGIVIGTKYATMEINKTFNSEIDCSNIPDYTNTVEVIKEYTDNSILARQKVKTYCFCRNNLIKKGIPNTQEVILNGVTICADWVDKYLYTKSLVIGTFILVPLVNVILSVLLTKLTELERNKSVETSSTSNMWKSFLLQWINTVSQLFIKIFRRLLFY
jgi:hypothetical protein